MSSSAGDVRAGVVTLIVFGTNRMLLFWRDLDSALTSLVLPSAWARTAGICDGRRCMNVS